MGGKWLCVARCVGLVCLLVLSGCIPGQHGATGMSGQPETTQQPPRQEPTIPAIQPIQASPPEPAGYRLTADDPLLVARLALYQQKKIEWEAAGNQLSGLGASVARPEAWNECLQALDLALGSYQRLQSGQERGLNPWDVVGHDLDYSTKDCNQVLASAQAKVAAGPDLSVNQIPETVANQIRQSFAVGQYQELVNACSALPKGKDGTLLAPRELKILCSRALVKLGRFPEAAAILTKLMAEVGQSLDLTALEARQLTADVLLAAGQVEEARQVYESLGKALAPVVIQQEWVALHIRAFCEQTNTEDLGIYRELIQAYLRFDGQQVPQALVDGVARLQGRASGSFADLAKLLLARASSVAQAWSRNQLLEIRALVAAHNLDRARELLQQLSSVAPVTMKAAITQLEVELAQAEVKAQEAPKPPAEAQSASAWEEALHLFEQQKYDEAIAAFQTMVESEHGDTAKAKIAEASELAAAALRQQAAGLYAKAKKTFDPEAKQQGLLSSRTLLLGLIEKYPNSSIADKARQNLKVLEAELGQATTPPLPVSPSLGSKEN